MYQQNQWKTLWNCLIYQPILRIVLWKSYVLFLFGASVGTSKLISRQCINLSHDPKQSLFPLPITFQVFWEVLDNVWSSAGERVLGMDTTTMINATCIILSVSCVIFWIFLLCIQVQLLTRSYEICSSHVIVAFRHWAGKTSCGTLALKCVNLTFDYMVHKRFCFYSRSGANDNRGFTCRPTIYKIRIFLITSHEKY